ncbi:Protein CBG26785 [Caenorhabditis briggsae]|nr:Protein CBG26785 [Caenorhabditis briggsae]CAR99277.1 Protein CBG26785 [Caenorhabditis briggsae]
MPTLPTDAQALIRTTQETENETVFSTSPISSSTTSPSIRLDSLTIAIIGIVVVGGLIIFVLFFIVLHVCLESEIRSNSLSESGRRYVPLGNVEEGFRRERLRIIRNTQFF